MCGILGQFSCDLLSEEQRLTLLNRLKHRGSDAEHFYQDSFSFLGHVRLSIIDLASGAQPMYFTYQGESYVFIYNGELYNFQPLKERLLSQGISFETNSDTEVIFKWLVTQGVERGILELNGIFAFCLYNVTAKCAYMARDRLGIKPFYFSHQGGAFCFASELDTLVEFPAVPKKMNPTVIPQFFYMGYAIPPDTFYENVYELLPATVLTYDGHSNQMSLTPYWSVYSYSRTYRGRYEDAVQELDVLLNQVVKDQLISDVSFGTFLSGGIDSSLVTALVAKQTQAPFRAYTVQFNDEKYDESPIAKKVAQSLPGVEHCVISTDRFTLDTAFFDLLITHVGQPFGDSSTIPTYLISKQVKAYGEKVILSGDGGDELFFGYEAINWLNSVHAFRVVPRFLRTVVNIIAQSNPMQMYRPELSRQIAKVVRYANEDDVGLCLSIKSFLDLVDVKRVQDDINFSWLKSLKERLACPRMSVLELYQMLLLSLNLYSDMLRKVDRMSMANALEIRVPLLDNRLIDFALQLPLDFCFNDGVKKRILRDVAKKYVPQEVLDHRKWGFCIPLHQAMPASLIEEHRSDIEKLPFVNPAFSRQMMDFKCHPSKQNHATYSQFTIDHANFNLIQLARWAKRVSLV